MLSTPNLREKHDMKQRLHIWSVVKKKMQLPVSCLDMTTLSSFSKILQNQFNFFLESSVMKVFSGHFCCWLKPDASVGLFDQEAYNGTAPEPIRSLRRAMISNS